MSQTNAMKTGCLSAVNMSHRDTIVNNVNCSGNKPDSNKARSKIHKFSTSQMLRRKVEVMLKKQNSKTITENTN